VKVSAPSRLHGVKLCVKIGELQLAALGQRQQSVRVRVEEHDADAVVGRELPEDGLDATNGNAKLGLLCAHMCGVVVVVVVCVFGAGGGGGAYVASEKWVPYAF
jgi:hypothetical protein